MPEIVLSHVTKRFGKFVAVRDLDLVIGDNGFVTLLGPSGCGKTTILRMIAGLETPTEGKISIAGETVFDADRGINVPPIKRDVGFLFQNYALWPHMTVYRNIAFGLENLKWDKARIHDRVTQLLQMLKIGAFEHRYPSELSGGQQQRVAIARTLAPNPRVLFMDEPLSNLDAKLRMEMRAELKRLHVDTDSTFVYVTHDQLEALTLSTRVCLLNEGRLQQYAPPLEMYDRPANLFAADFIGSPTMNFIDGRAKKATGDTADLSLGPVRLRFESREPFELPGDEVILGIRPEYVDIREDGALQATVYSTLPAGIETTLRLVFGDRMITSVVFGGVDFPVDSAVRYHIRGGNIVLFDKKTGDRAANGSVAVL